MSLRGDPEIPLQPAPSPSIPAWRYGPEIYDYRLPPSALPPLDPRIQPEPVVPRIFNPPPDVNPFGTPPRNLPPGPAPSAPPIMPKPDYYRPPSPSPQRLDQIPQSDNWYPPGQPAPAVQNLTTHALRMKGVPEADIGAAINDPARMKDLLNRYYGRPPVIPTGGDSSGFGNKDGRDAS